MGRIERQLIRIELVCSVVAVVDVAWFWTKKFGAVHHSASVLEAFIARPSSILLFYPVPTLSKINLVLSLLSQPFCVLKLPLLLLCH
jgi:hypothetical protein